MPCPSQPDKARFSGSPSGGQLYRLLDQHLSGAVESAELADECEAALGNSLRFRAGRIAPKSRTACRPYIG